MPETSVPPYLPLVPFKLLSLCWSSERVSLSKSVCGSLGGTAWDSRSFFQQLNPCFSAARTYGDLSTCIGKPGVELGLFAPKITPLNFYPLHVGVGPVCEVSLPLLAVWMDVVSLIL